MLIYALVGRKKGGWSMKCPICKKAIISTEGQKHKLRTRIIIFDRGKAIAKCQNCKSDVEIPIRFNRRYEEFCMKNELYV